MAVNLNMNSVSDPANYVNVVKAKRSSSSPAGDTQYRRGALRLAGVGVGVMCIIQATLNIVLRLYFTNQMDVAAMSCDNLTLSKDIKQLQGRYDSLLKERDRLQTKLYIIGVESKKPGWIIFGSSSYYMSAQKTTWKDARSYCKDNGGDLVIIESREEQDFIETLIRKHPAWIGLTDQVSEGVWTWVDGSLLTTNAYWRPGEPNNSGDEDCVVTGYNSNDTLNTWNDDPCMENWFWVCEKKIYFEN